MKLRLEYKVDGNLIRKHRKFLRLNVQQASDIAGMNAKYWSTIESNGRIPAIKTLCVISASLSCNPGEFFKEVKYNG